MRRCAQCHTGWAQKPIVNTVMTLISRVKQPQLPMI